MIYVNISDLINYNLFKIAKDNSIKEGNISLQIKDENIKEALIKGLELPSKNDKTLILEIIGKIENNKQKYLFKR